jgi:ribosomal protein S13
MKRIILLFSFFMIAFSANTQNREEHRERIKAMKIAYFTQEMNMNPQVAQQFWPIYNRYECLRRDLHIREDVDIDLDNIEGISEARAEEMLKEYVAVEKEEYELKKEMFSELKKILSAKDIMKLQKLESDFNRKLIKEYRARKAAERKNK